VITDLESMFSGRPDERWPSDGADQLEEALGIRFPTDYREVLAEYAGRSFDYLFVPYPGLGDRTDYFDVGKLLTIPAGDWVQRLASGPDTEIDESGVANGFRVFAYLDWLTMGGWWPLLVPIIASDGFGYFAYDFRYSREAPPIIAVSHEMFELPSDADFDPPKYVSGSFESLLRMCEQQDSVTGAFPSEKKALEPAPGAADWEFLRNQWLSEIDPRVP